MRKLVVAAAVCVGALALAALAYATSANTTMDASARLANLNTGTKAKPEAEKVNITIEQTDPDPQPPTSVRLLLDFPGQINFNGLKRWSLGRRCDSRKADQAKSNSVCPRGSRVGRVHVTAKAANGGITQILTGVVHVIKPRSGSARGPAGLGFWITSTSPVAIAQFLPGKINFRTGVLDVSIPKNLQEPVAGVKSAIQRLTASVAGRDPKGGALVRSTGCPRSRGMNLKITSVNDDGGRVSDTAIISCRP